jgi:uncharacterized protein (TIGR01777 family)
MKRFVHRTRIRASAAEAFRWHTRPGAFQRLTPPWEQVRVLSQSGGIRDNDEVTLETFIGPFAVRWVALHQDLIEGVQFRDVQVKGPFARWEHTHRFTPDGEGAFWMEDTIDYELPIGALGRIIAGPTVAAKLARAFHYRHEVLTHDLLVHQASRGDEPLNILVTGTSGLIGSAVVPFLTAGGHTVVKLSRQRAGERGASAGWNPAAGEINLTQAGAIDAVVHLAGESVAQRWTPQAKQRIRESRVAGTRLLAAALARLPQPPKVLVCASATGFYGDRGDEWLDESGTQGRGFLADVVRDWEAAAAPAVESGIRVVHLRFGIVLGLNGGALKKMLPAFRVGLGGRIADGRAWWSWIALDDVLGVVHQALTNASLRGVVNAVSPTPVTNEGFTEALGRVLHRPAIFPVPRFAVELLFGEMGREALLASFRVKPVRLVESGFRFSFPDLEPALRHLLGRPGQERRPS